MTILHNTRLPPKVNFHNRCLVLGPDQEKRRDLVLLMQTLTWLDMTNEQSRAQEQHSSVFIDVLGKVTALLVTHMLLWLQNDKKYVHF